MAKRAREPETGGALGELYDHVKTILETPEREHADIEYRADIYPEEEEEAQGGPAKRLGEFSRLLKDEMLPWIAKTTGPWEDLTFYPLGDAPDVIVQSGELAFERRVVEDEKTAILYNLERRFQVTREGSDSKPEIRGERPTAGHEWVAVAFVAPSWKPPHSDLFYDVMEWGDGSEHRGLGTSWDLVYDSFCPPLRFLIVNRDEQKRQLIFLRLAYIVLPPSIRGKGSGARFVFEMQMAAMTTGVAGVLADFCHQPFLRAIQRSFNGWLDYWFNRDMTRPQFDDGPVERVAGDPLPFFPKKMGPTAYLLPWHLEWATPATAAWVALERDGKTTMHGALDYFFFKFQRELSRHRSDETGYRIRPDGESHDRIRIRVRFEPHPPQKYAKETNARLGRTLSLFGLDARMLVVEEMWIYHSDSSPYMRSTLLQFFVGLARALVCPLLIKGDVQLLLSTMALMVEDSPSDVARYYHDLPGMGGWPDFVVLDDKSIYTVPECDNVTRPAEGSPYPRFETKFAPDADARWLSDDVTTQTKGSKVARLHQCLLCDTALERADTFYCDSCATTLA